MSTMRFCRECNSTLYPKEDRRNRVLYYACRSCDHQEVADSNLVYRNVVDHAAGELTQVFFEDVASDPTIPRTRSVRCAACGHGEAAFMQSLVRSEEDMTLFFVCCNPSCGHKWRE
ncbi:unnamed protein product [Urochloa decumbens]|uniref:DNA-directed RNA polymerase subunit n=1 Tax=Urochloa decumbens TaxID=240449 RepID=A0ABC9AWA3_9POAL